MNRILLFLFLFSLFACGETQKEKLVTITDSTKKTVAVTPNDRGVHTPKKLAGGDVHYGANASIKLLEKTRNSGARQSGASLTYELHGNKHEELWFYKPVEGTEMQLIPEQTINEYTFLLRDNLGEEKGILEITAYREEEGFAFPAEVSVKFNTGESIYFTE
ncbi:MAG TPA: hypothetical protein VK177_12380 [Flavobacteriales bacterium]|nr:hypothetical protein [Flavobacteriales bacterium]